MSSESRRLRSEVLSRKKLAVVAPSFTADCVETLEDNFLICEGSSRQELGITGQEQFQEAGGEELVSD